MDDYRSTSVNAIGSGEVNFFFRTPGLAAGVMLVLLLAVCLLTWFDPLVRKDRTTGVIAVGGWLTASVFATWQAVFVENPLAIVTWGAAGIYLLAIVTTLGRPILILSSLLEEMEEEDGVKLPPNLWRRSKLAQFLLLTGIAVALALIML